MILISQKHNALVPWPCAVRMQAYDTTGGFAVIANSYGQEFVMAVYKEIAPAKMELGRLEKTITEGELPPTFQFVRDVP